ncbi:MAG: hypothetical protein ACFFG0_17625 [Candidatus Thorarchaeota archaeon]
MQGDRTEGSEGDTIGNVFSGNRASPRLNKRGLTPKIGAYHWTNENLK